MSPYLDAIEGDLAAIVSTAGEQAGVAAEHLVRALQPSLRLHLLDAVSEAASELDPQLRSGRVDVRLSGGDVSLVYIEEPSAPASGDDLWAASRCASRSG